MGDGVEEGSQDIRMEAGECPERAYPSLLMFSTKSAAHSVDNGQVETTMLYFVIWTQMYGKV
jgi:hypothetical protein